MTSSLETVCSLIFSPPGVCLLLVSNHSALHSQTNHRTHPLVKNSATHSAQQSRNRAATEPQQSRNATGNDGTRTHTPLVVQYNTSKQKNKKNKNPARDPKKHPGEDRKKTDGTAAHTTVLLRYTTTVVASRERRTSHPRCCFLQHNDATRHDTTCRCPLFRRWCPACRFSATTPRKPRRRYRRRRRRRLLLLGGRFSLLRSGGRSPRR